MSSLLSYTTHHRASSRANDPEEDATVIAAQDGVFGVVDGTSAAYSPTHPVKKYEDGLTGGAIVARILASSVVSGDLSVTLRSANQKVRDWCCGKNLIPGIHDTPAAGFALMSIQQDGSVSFALAGDCYVLMADRSGGHTLFSGCDAQAEQVEEEGKKQFGQFQHQAMITGENVWDLYYQTFRARRLRFYNRRVGDGGIPMLNGQTEFLTCYRHHKKLVCKEIAWVLLGTDGLCPKFSVGHNERSGEFGKIYNPKDVGRFQALARASDNQQPHYVGGNPEGTVVEVIFR